VQRSKFLDDIRREWGTDEPVIDYNLLSQALNKRYKGYLNLLDESEPELQQNKRAFEVINSRLQSLTALGSDSYQKKTRDNLQLRALNVHKLP